MSALHRGGNLKSGVEFSIAAFRRTIADHLIRFHFYWIHFTSDASCNGIHFNDVPPTNRTQNNGLLLTTICETLFCVCVCTNMATWKVFSNLSSRKLKFCTKGYKYVKRSSLPTSVFKLLLKCQNLLSLSALVHTVFQHSVVRAFVLKSELSSSIVY